MSPGSDELSDGSKKFFPLTAALSCLRRSWLVVIALVERVLAERLVDRPTLPDVIGRSVEDPDSAARCFRLLV